ncbi:MAG: low molecular weight phosphotyrosine protein phosphatase [Myxococcales bacterium]|nr:low molecular weight phosphotyrosine protein phosphatase [Myxococcales bacterium]
MSDRFELLDDSIPIRIQFVCLGNICRSPLAEAILLHLAEIRGVRPRLVVKSAGTSDYHVGEGADPGSVRVAREFGIDLTAHRARQFVPPDFLQFDYILGMDQNNLKRILAVKPPESRVVTGLLLDFAHNTPETDVPDPWGGGHNVFRDVFLTIQRGCEGLLAHLRTTGQIR